MMGTAAVQSDLWGAQVRDWADIGEGLVRPLYDAILDKLAVGTHTRLLDVGCGAGMFCMMASQRGAQVSGFDATAALIEVAKERTPQGDFQVGDMESLPYSDDTFNLVTGFNSFQYAADPVKSLSEARRVARKGSPVVIAVWGREEDCQAATYFAALATLLPPPPPGTPGPFALSQPGRLGNLVSQAGLTPTEMTEDVDCPFEFPDHETALRGIMCSGAVTRAVRATSPERVREVISTAIAPFHSADGSYRIENKFRYLVCTA